jgi:hypothetical protein
MSVTCRNAIHCASLKGRRPPPAASRQSHLSMTLSLSHSRESPSNRHIRTGHPRMSPIPHFPKASPLHPASDYLSYATSPGTLYSSYLSFLPYFVKDFSGSPYFPSPFHPPITHWKLNTYWWSVPRGDRLSSHARSCVFSPINSSL